MTEKEEKTKKFDFGSLVSDQITETVAPPLGVTEPTPPTEPPKATPPKGPSKMDLKIKELESANKELVNQLRDTKIQLNEARADTTHLSEQISKLERDLNKKDADIQYLSIDLQHEKEKPSTASEVLDLVRTYMWEHPKDPMSAKAIRHLPPNPEWKGSLGKGKAKKSGGGGWSGAWKDFARLFELALKEMER